MNEPLNVNILECVQDGSNVSVPEFSSDLRVSTRTTYYAFYDELHFRNLCAKWVPHFLTQDQRKEGANFFRILLNKFGSDDPKSLTEMVKGDETWVYF